MRGDAIRARVLSARLIPNADAALLKQFGLKEDARSLGIITADSDDVAYAALDEATKHARVSVAFAQSMYAGAKNASTRLAGEFLGILAGPEPEEVRSGLKAAIDFIETGASFYSADDTDSVIYFAHCISSSGSYLSAQAGIPQGQAMAYLIAPPTEAVCALDAALKAALVELCVYYPPPTPTNFAGALLTGEQAACKAACEAFADMVCQVAENPLRF